MEVDLILALAAAGTMLGVVEGLKPGPLMTMVVRETLSGGLKAGIWTAAAPIFTDGPLIFLSVVIAAQVANSPHLLLAITVAGALFLAKMGVDCFNLDPPDFSAEPSAPSSSLLRGVITNLLNPNAYVFWFLIGGPLMASVVQEEWLAPVAYALSFLLTLMLTKAVVAYAVHKASNGISDIVYKRLLAGCGVVMLGFSAFYVRTAWQLL